MAFFNKYFLLNFLFGGFLGTAATSIRLVIEYGWYRGLIKGAVSGLLFGLFIAFLSAEDYSKPVYPMDIDRSRFAAEDGQSNFHPAVPSYLLIVLWTVFIIVLLIIGTGITRDFTHLLDTPFLLVLSIFAFVYRRNSRLCVFQDGIEYRAILYRIKMKWEEIERIEKRGNKWFLIYRANNINAMPIIRSLIKVYEVDRRLNLSNFSLHFLDSELAKTIFYHAEQIPVMTTG